MKQLTIYHVPVEGSSGIKEIKDELHVMQDLVGGLIEFVSLGPFFENTAMNNVELVCNEEGKINRLPINFSIANDIILGDVFFVGMDYNTGECISLTKEQIEFLDKIFGDGVLPLWMI